jgi:N-methylhydantoinase B
VLTIEGKNKPTDVRIKDPITFEVVKNGLLSLADELAITVVRTAHSQTVRDVMDFSTAICDRNGRVVAQGCGIPFHLGSLPDAMDAVIAKFGSDTHAGDIFVLNDPDEGGMHLPDAFLIKPVFSGEDLVGYSACVAHHQDIGGRAAGGNAVDSTEIFQEGLQIPLLKLYDRGRLDKSLLALWLRNVRIPDIVYGDIQAQLAACHTGEVGLLQFADRYTPAGLQALMDEILDYTEARVRAAIATIPQGDYLFEDHIDDDGFGSGPILIKVRITVLGDRVDVDFDGTSLQVKAALNATMSFTRAAVYAALMCVLGTDIPSNAGFYRPITVTAPKGTILNPTRPAPRAARGLTGFRTLDATLGALSKAMPELVPAAGEGGATMIAFGGTDRQGAAYICVDFVTCGWGARPDRDGVDAVSPIGANAANIPIEEIELHQPVRIEQYSFVPDTEGAGKWRGCLSIVREYQLLSDEGVLQIRSDRRLFPPYGLAGGDQGSPSNNVLNPGPNQQVLPTKLTMPIQRGDILRHTLAGGGGHGDPLERDPKLVLEDVLDEKVSVERARTKYGVVIDLDQGRIDLGKTKTQRAKYSRAN